MGPTMEHNTQTHHDAMALGGLTKLAAPEPLLTDSTQLPSRPFPRDVTLCKARTTKIYRWTALTQPPTNLVSIVRMCLMCIRVRPISSHEIILMLSWTACIRPLQPEISGRYCPEHCHGRLSVTWYAICTKISNYLRTVVPKKLQGLPPSCESEFEFHQDDAHALYEEYSPQWLSTILLFVCCAWGLIIGYLVSMQVTRVIKSKVIRLSCVIVFQTYCLTMNRIIGTLCTNLFSFSTLFHVEVARQNHQP
jgi:hypothetical protein